MVKSNGRLQILKNTFGKLKIPFIVLTLMGSLSLPVQAAVAIQYSDDMESGLGNWMNVSVGDNKEWTRDKAGTPSSNTGPSNGANGSSFYAYLETSSGSAYALGDTAILEGPSINGANVHVAFNYHMFGSNIGSLAIDVLENGEWVADVWRVSGQQHASNSTAYSFSNVDLSSYTPSKIRFRATAVGGYMGDMAIDNIEVISEPAGPVAPVFLESSFDKAAAREGQQYSETLVGEALDVNGDSLTFSKVSGPDWLLVADDGTLSGIPTASDVGDSHFGVAVSDGTFSSGAALTIYVVDINAPLLLSRSDFEAGLGDWVNVNLDDNKNWSRHLGSTASSNTGPNSGAENSNYYTYLETSSGSAYTAGDDAILLGPDLANSKTLLKFDYHMYGSDIGTLAVDVFSLGAWISDVWTLSGQQHISNSAAYTSVQVDLSAYDVSQIRLRAIAVGGYMGDIGLDNIEIYQIDPAATDSDNDGINYGDDLCPETPVGESVNVDGCSLSQVDSDGDGISDLLDTFPNDAAEWADFDGDSIGNNSDTDDDNDGVLDVNDDLPLNANESIDTDGDGIGNNADTDDDNDGISDVLDVFPFDASESLDNDADGVGNNADADDDNDGVQDSVDAFPFDSSESVDTDFDGLGNNADTDDDNDGVQDSTDAFPLNANEYLDTDLDGVGNNADLDDDNDGLSDLDETNIHSSNPLSIDSDNDGMADGWEVQHGLLVNTNDAAGDNNYDGLSNLDEFLAGNDPSSPFITSTLPALGATEILVSTALVVNFSESIEPASVSSATFFVSDGMTSIDGMVTLSGSDTQDNVSVTFTPSSPLTPSAVYTATINQSVMDVAGNTLKEDYQWSFTVQESYSLAGSVMYQGQALAGVNLVISNADNVTAPIINGITDVSGLFYMEGFVPGNYTISPSLLGYSFTPAPMDVLVSDSHLLNLDFQAGDIPVIYVPADYLTIQAAVDDVLAGSTIVVADGTYNENLVIDKPLTVTSANGSESTLITALNENQHVIIVQAENVSISGFDISGATTYYKSGIYFASGSHYGKAFDNKCGYDDVHRNYIGISSFESDYLEITNNFCNDWGLFGIRLVSSNEAKVIGNTATDHGFDGIQLDDCNACVVSGNITLRNRTGIQLSDVTDAIITHNISNENTGSGIQVTSSGHITITNNEIKANKENGVHINKSGTSTIMGNTVNNNNGAGIYVEASGISEVKHNIVESNDSSGIVIYSSNYSTVNENTVDYNAYGIYINNSNYTKVFDNDLARNDSGIRLNYADFNQIMNNSTIANRFGIYLGNSDDNLIIGNHFNTPLTGTSAYGGYTSGSKNNTFYLNYFKGSASGGSLGSSNGSINIWVSPVEKTYVYNGVTYTGYLGNYFDEHNLQDSDGDGITDFNMVLPADEPVATYPLAELPEAYQL